MVSSHLCTVNECMKTWDNWRFLARPSAVGHVVLAMFICLNVNAPFQKPDVLNKFQRLRMGSAEVSLEPKSAVWQLNSVSSWAQCCRLYAVLDWFIRDYGDEVLRFTIHACPLVKDSGGSKYKYITLLGMS